MSVETTGLDQLLSACRELQSNAGEMMHRSMQPTWDQVFDRSQEYTPVETGALKASGKQDPPQVGRTEVVLSITYGEGLDYAFWVHEILRNRHAAPTRAKYVETAVNEIVPNAGPAVSAALTAEVLKIFR